MLKKLLLSLLLISCGSMFGMNNENEQQKLPSRRLAVFFTGLEDMRNPAEPSSIQAIYAIHQKAAPLLIQKNVIYNALFLEKNKFKSGHFNFHAWIIRKIGEHFLLLIPKLYLIEKKIQSMPSLEQIIDNTSPTDFELELGLWVDHLEAISEEDFYKEIKIRTLPKAIGDNRKMIVTKFMSQEFNDMFYDTEKKTSNLFVTKTAYPFNKKKSIPQWIVYWQGHGSEEVIGELHSKDFTVLLNFLNSKITTKFLVIYTCFAGYNIEKYHTHLNNFSYTIAATSLTSNCATINANDIFNFELFFSALEKKHDQEQFENALNAVMGFKKNCNNIPLIQNKKEPSFKVIDAKNIITINSVMGTMRKKTVSLPSFFPHKRPSFENPLCLLIYASRIQFPLIIPTGTKIISMNTQNAHIFEEITINTDFLDDLYNMYRCLEEINGTFFIKKLIMKHRIFYNVLFTVANQLYFSENNQNFLYENTTLEKIEKNYLTKYKNFIDASENSCYRELTPSFVQKLETLHKNYPSFIPDEKNKTLHALRIWWNNLFEKQQTIIKASAIDQASNIIVSDSYEFNTKYTHTNLIQKYKLMCSLEHLKKLEDARIKNAFYGQHLFLKSKI